MKMTFVRFKRIFFYYFQFMFFLLLEFLIFWMARLLWLNDSCINRVANHERTKRWLRKSSYWQFCSNFIINWWVFKFILLFLLLFFCSMKFVMCAALIFTFNLHIHSGFSRSFEFSHDASLFAFDHVFNGKCLDLIFHTFYDRIFFFWSWNVFGGDASRWCIVGPLNLRFSALFDH